MSLILRIFTHAWKEKIARKKKIRINAPKQKARSCATVTFVTMHRGK